MGRRSTKLLKKINTLVFALCALIQDRPNKEFCFSISKLFPAFSLILKTTNGKDFLREINDIYNVFNIVHREKLLGRNFVLFISSAIVCRLTSPMRVKMFIFKIICRIHILYCRISKSRANPQEVPRTE